MFTIGSLFTAAGGIDIGFHAEGFQNAWFCEFDPESKKPHEEQYAVRILKRRYPGTPVYGDIAGVDFSKVRRVNGLIGGFPCQDISTAGKRVGISGSRSSLWKHYARAISHLLPEFAFIENVSALTCRGLDTVLCDLASLGYDAEWHCVPASAVGAPHRRDRIFIIAYRQGHRGRYLAMERQQDEEDSDLEWGRQDVEHTDKSRRYRIYGGGAAQLTPDGCADVPYSTLGRLEKWQRDQEPSPHAPSEGRWAAEPRLGRVAHGIPNRVDRIRCLGLAVVPQVAQVFARAIRKELIGVKS